MKTLTWQNHQAWARQKAFHLCQATVKTKTRCKIKVEAIHVWLKQVVEVARAVQLQELLQEGHMIHQCHDRAMVLTSSQIESITRSSWRLRKSRPSASRRTLRSLHWRRGTYSESSWRQMMIWGRKLSRCNSSASAIKSLRQLNCLYGSSRMRSLRVARIADSLK